MTTTSATDSLPVHKSICYCFIGFGLYWPIFSISNYQSALSRLISEYLLLFVGRAFASFFFAYSYVPLQMFISCFLEWLISTTFLDHSTLWRPLTNLTFKKIFWIKIKALIDSPSNSLFCAAFFPFNIWNFSFLVTFFSLRIFLFLYIKMFL